MTRTQKITILGHVHPNHMISAVATQRAPLTTACAPPFRFTRNTSLEYHATTRQERKKNNNVQT